MRWSRYLCFAAMAFLMAGIGYASPISFGKLSSNDDGLTAVIHDDLNQLDWLRWDRLKSLTYAQTLAVIAPGGTYEGWSVAGIAKAQQFVDALLFGRTNGCTTTSTVLTETCADGPLPDLTPLFGDNYTTDQDNKFFLSDNATGTEVGIVGYYRGSLFDTVRKQNDWDTLAHADQLAASNSIGWLLYRETAVPVPSTWTMFGIGAAALFAARLRIRRRP